VIAAVDSPAPPLASSTGAESTLGPEEGGISVVGAFTLGTLTGSFGAAGGAGDGMGSEGARVPVTDLTPAFAAPTTASRSPAAAVGTPRREAARTARATENLARKTGSDTSDRLFRLVKVTPGSRFRRELELLPNFLDI
jgi:hypothetical protein